MATTITYRAFSISINGISLNLGNDDVYHKNFDISEDGVWFYDPSINYSGERYRSTKSASIRKLRKIESQMAKGFSFESASKHLGARCKKEIRDLINHTNNYKVINNRTAYDLIMYINNGILAEHHLVLVYGEWGNLKTIGETFGVHVTPSRYGSVSDYVTGDYYYNSERKNLCVMATTSLDTFDKLLTYLSMTDYVYCSDVETHVIRDLSGVEPHYLDTVNMECTITISGNTAVGFPHYSHASLCYYIT